MPSSMNRIGNNPFFRPNNVGGALNNQRATEEKAFRQMLKNTPFKPSSERDVFRDYLKNTPFRPSVERRIPSPIPKIPYREVQSLRKQALAIALRIARKPTPAHLFRQILQWLFEELVKWLIRRWNEKRAGGGWMKVAQCANPLPEVGPRTYLVSGLYPANNTTKNFANNCLASQAISRGQPTLFGPGGSAGEYAMHQVSPPRYQAIAVYQKPLGGTIPYFIVVDDQEMPRIENPPPARIRPALKPDWKALIEDRIPETEYPEKPDDSPPEQREETKEVEIKYAPRVQVQTRRLTRTRKPTRSNTKEKKFAASGQTIRQIFGWLSRNKERLTELVDFLDILIDSMPKDIQSKEPKRNGRTTPDLKAKFIYDNWDKIDWNKFADEWVKNWIEDKAVGTAIAQSDKAAKVRGETNAIGSRGSWLHNAIGGAHFPKG